MKITHDLKIDLVRPEIVPPVAVVQGDTYTREINIALHANGESWSLPNGHDIVIRYSKPDGTIGIYDTLPDGSVAWSSEGNTVSVMLAPQMLTCPGKVSAQVSIIVGSSIISTFTFFVIVEADPSKGAVRSENYNNWRKAFVPQTTGAKVGQYLQISKVDDAGRIIEVVPVENPAGEATKKAYEALRIANDVAQEMKAYSPSGTRSIAEAAMRTASSRLVAPPSASVGQYFRVKEVDTNGMVTAVEAVDAPSADVQVVGEVTPFTTEEELATMYASGIRLVTINPSENLVSSAIDQNGAVFYGCGYLKGYRLTSSGGVSQADESVITGFIPYVPGKALKITGALHNEQEFGNYLAAYNSAFELVGVDYLYDSIYDSGGSAECDADNNKTFTINVENLEWCKNAAYIRISINPCVGRKLQAMYI